MRVYAINAPPCEPRGDAKYPSAGKGRKKKNKIHVQKQNDDSCLVSEYNSVSHRVHVYSVCVCVCAKGPPTLYRRRVSCSVDCYIISSGRKFVLRAERACVCRLRVAARYVVYVVSRVHSVPFFFDRKNRRKKTSASVIMSISYRDLI